MHNQVYAPYLEGQGFQVVELAYAGGTAAMDLFVPDAGTFEAFEDAFDSRLYGEALQAMKPATVDLALPKFTFESGLGLSGTLGAMGMADAFSPDRADFSGMTGARDLFISDVIHKAFIAVDEKGTEAAAATAVIMETTSAPLYDVILKVDRPFLFVIRDTVNGQILFIGRVLNPQP
jgi:serpin B